jgi:hypothetical protein
MMIKSCKYCLSNISLCPRCEAHVVTRTITETLPEGHAVSTTLFICVNPQCADYGTFKLESTRSTITHICENCAARAKKMAQFQEDLKKAFSQRSDR